MMNEIKSDFSGKVISIDLEDGQPVEYGQSIITIN
jgi:acetyl-CoA carboxylase biotin carboxyl carrier protein